MMPVFLEGLTALPAIAPDAQAFPLILTLLTCLTLLVTVAGLSSTLRSRKNHQALIHRIKGGSTPALVGSSGANVVLLRWFFKMLKVVGEVNTPTSDKKLSVVRRSLVKAGYRSPEASGIFFGVKIYTTVLIPLVYAALRPLLARALPTTAFVFVLLAAIGFYAPDIWIRMRIRHRQQKVLAGFPDALDLMVICVEAGLSLDAAIHKVAEEIQMTNRVVSEEFKLLALGLRAGQSRQIALMSLSRRVDVQEVNSFVELIIQTDLFGTSIAQALRVQADAMRLKRRMWAEEKANELPVKLLFPLLFFIFPSLMLIILGPGIIRLMKVLTDMLPRLPAG